MPVYPTRYKLPNGHAREIGHIVTRWAYVEQRFKYIIYMLAGIGPKEGRILSDYLGVSRKSFPLLRKLMKRRGLEENFRYKEVRKQFRLLEEFRNAIAHGAWMKHDQTRLPVLQVTRDAGFLKDLAPNKSDAQIDPRSFPVSVEYLREVVKALDVAAKFIDQLFREVKDHMVQLGASRMQ